MPAVTVTVPGLLARFTGGERSVQVDADTVEDAIDRLVEAHPTIEPHLFERTEGFRPHLQCFHNGRSVDQLGAPSIPLSPGDEVTILQAVSGGVGTVDSR